MKCMESNEVKGVSCQTLSNANREKGTEQDKPAKPRTHRQDNKNRTKKSIEGRRK
jgi:hypothetical protein